MTHETIAPHQSPTTGAAELALARSELLDAFSDLETRIHGMVKHGKADVKPQNLGAKVEMFRKLDGVSQIAKANYVRRDQLADKIADLLPLRADIVHSRMQVSTVDGTPTGIFINSQNQKEAYPSCRLLTADELRDVSRKLAILTAEIGTLGRVNPASSTQPPSPDAAGVP